MQEKLKNDTYPQTSSSDVEDQDVHLTESLEDFKSGRVKLMIGHAESWVSDIAQEILNSLQEKDHLANFLG